MTHELRVGLRLVPLAAGSWLGAGLGVGLPPRDAAALSVAAALVVVLGSWVTRPAVVGRVAGVVWPRLLGGLAVLVLLAAGFGVGCASAGAQQTARLAGVSGPLVERSATVRALVIVRGQPRQIARQQFSGEPQWLVRVRAIHLEGRGLSGESRAPLLVIGPAQWSSVKVGEQLEVRGRLKAADPGDDVVAIVRPSAPPQSRAPPSRGQRWAEHVRHRLRTACAGLPPDAAGLLPGLVVGDTSNLPTDLEADMQATGLTHLTAVSGANITIVAGAMLYLATHLGVRRGPRVVLAAVAVLTFVVVAGNEPSVLRATVMGLIGLLGLVLARRSIGLAALSAAIVGLTVVDPWLARSAGFALSVSATLGLLLLARPIEQTLSRFMPRWMALALAVPTAAQAAVGPVCVLINPAIPLLAVPANLAVEPAVAPITVLGALAALIGVVWLPAAQLLTWLASWPLLWIAFIAHRLAAVPGANLPWPEGLPGAALLAGVTVLGLGLLLVGVRVVNLERGRVPTIPPVRAVVLVLCAGLVVGLLAWPRVRALTTWPEENWRLVACDVGQGTAAVLRSGPGAAVVIDAGPDPEAVDRCLRRLHITVIDLIVLTHFHADHVDGLPGVLRHRQVGQAWVTDLAEPRRNAEQVLRQLGAAGVPVRVPDLGEHGIVGDLGYRVIGPGRARGATTAPSEGEEGPAANDASLAVWVQAPGLSVVSLGDAELDGQNAALAHLRQAGLESVDAVLVAHHGSAKQVPALYERLAPRVGLISVGRDNDYGHPTPSALRLLGRLQVRVLRTDQCGDAAVLVPEEGLQVACRSP